MSRKIKEAVLTCEGTKCTWPLGYEDFIFCPRIVGKIWSCYWNDYKTVPKIKEVFTTSKLTSCNAPTINSKNVLFKYNTDFTSNTNCSEGINVNDTVNAIEIKNNKKDQSDIVNDRISEDTINSLSLKNSKLQSANECTENIKTENKFINTCNEYVGEKKDIYMQCIKGTSNVKGIPKITNIERTNIDISNAVIRNQSSGNNDTHKKLVSVNEFAQDIDNKLICLTRNNRVPISEKLLSSEPFTDSNQLSDELALKTSASSVSGIMTTSIQQSNYTTSTTAIARNIKNSNTSEMKGLSVKRNITSGKQYEKFSFSAIKKKLKENNTIDSNSENVKDSNNKNTHNTPNNQKVINYKNNYDQMIPTINVTCNNVITQNSDSITTNFLNEENTSSDTTILNTTVNIDTVLEDLLNNDYTICEDINDEWVNSFLS
ncbi:uncharacterized protein LOC143188329 isoform X2 [Calliopsis andreniformis]|uniref:uncharacterized protein LOC143188329 isoform X2 n=1 Tax=Calliopsis andreniformis TaxID=337506 RepID=UPI003FCC66D0